MFITDLVPESVEDLKIAAGTFPPDSDSFRGSLQYQKLSFFLVHNNPVDAGLVFRPEHYIYSSALDYSGEKGLIEGVVVVK